MRIYNGDYRDSVPTIILHILAIIGLVVGGFWSVINAIGLISGRTEDYTGFIILGSTLMLYFMIGIASDIHQILYYLKSRDNEEDEDEKEQNRGNSNE